MLAQLEPAVKADLWEQRSPEPAWRVRAGDSSPINDDPPSTLTGVIPAWRAELGADLGKVNVYGAPAAHA